jgi:hypothetical protein
VHALRLRQLLDTRLLLVGVRALPVRLQPAAAAASG